MDANKYQVLGNQDQTLAHLISYHSPLARTSGVSLCLTRTMMVRRVSRMPRLAMQMGRIANMEPCHMYCTCTPLLVSHP